MIERSHVGLAHDHLSARQTYDALQIQEVGSCPIPAPVRQPRVRHPRDTLDVTLSVGRTVQCWDNALAPNFPDPRLEDWAAAYHGGNLARLAAAKHAYDPDRLFRFPQAI